MAEQIQILKQQATEQTAVKTRAEILSRFGFFCDDDSVYQTAAPYLRFDSNKKLMIQSRIGYFNPFHGNEVVIEYHGSLDQVVDACHLMKTCEHCKIPFAERFSATKDLRMNIKILEEIAERQGN